MPEPTEPQPSGVTGPAPAHPSDDETIGGSPGWHAHEGNHGWLRHHGYPLHRHRPTGGEVTRVCSDYCQSEAEHREAHQRMPHPPGDNGADMDLCWDQECPGQRPDGLRVPHARTGWCLHADPPRGMREPTLADRVWAEWNNLPEGCLAPVKLVARNLDMAPAAVAVIVYPPGRFGTWDESQEPDLPAPVAEDAGTEVPATIDRLEPLPLEPAAVMRRDLLLGRAWRAFTGWVYGLFHRRHQHAYTFIHTDYVKPAGPFPGLSGETGRTVVYKLCWCMRADQLDVQVVPGKITLARLAAGKAIASDPASIVAAAQPPSAQAHAIVRAALREVMEDAPAERLDSAAGQITELLASAALLAGDGDGPGHVAVRRLDETGDVLTFRSSDTARRMAAQVAEGRSERRPEPGDYSYIPPGGPAGGD